MPDTRPIERLVIFGATGDLAARMLLPSLYFLDLDGLLPKELKIIGSARSDLSKARFAEHVHDILKHRPEGLKDDVWTRFKARLDYCKADVTSGAGMKPLAEHVGEASTMFFLALSPSLYGAVCKALDESGLACGDCCIVLEKPLGHDLESSKTINAEVAAVFDESRVFRIDHYLGKETVQNLVALRFANTLFEPLWNNLAIDHVQITVAETEGVGDRWPYYDEYGALRDMVQNHMMQLLCLVAMEPPPDAEADSIRDEKVKVLKSLKPFDRASAHQLSVRGQYKAGVVEGKQVKSYAEERGGPTDTETFVALRCEIDNWRWAGVPFFLRTGKRLGGGERIISIAFREPPKSMFPAGSGVGTQGPDHLTFDLADSSKLSLSFYGKKPGPGMNLEKLSLQFALHETGQDADILEAYERLIHDAMIGDHTLFNTAEGIERLWELSEPLLENPPPVLPYEPGSWGPDAIRELIAPRTWRLPFERRWRASI